MSEWKLPENITWMPEGRIYLNLKDYPDLIRWAKFAEVESKGCVYAGYENCEEGEDYRGGFLYLRFSKKSGSVTGAKLTPDCIDAVANAWNDYDTPPGALRGYNFIRYLSKVHAEKVSE